MREQDAPQTVASVEKSTAKPADEDDEQDAVAEPKAGKEDEKPVLVLRARGCAAIRRKEVHPLARIA
jgi:hypothetical protein